MFGEILDLPVKIGEIKDHKIYYRGWHGSTLLLSVFDGSKNLIARGSGMAWNDDIQQTPYMEWAQRKCMEIITGAYNPGQITFQTLNFLHLDDSLPTARDLPYAEELTGIVQVASHEDAKIRGLVINVFEGVLFRAQSGNWNAQTLYARNGTLIYRERLTGLQWLEKNPDFATATTEHAAYPATSNIPA
jgi:hypothetical protein